MRLAFCNPFLKQRIVDEFIDTVGDGSDLSPTCHSHFVKYLVRFFAEQAKPVVGEAELNGKLDYTVCGHFDFIYRLGQDGFAGDPYAGEAQHSRTR